MPGSGGERKILNRAWRSAGARAGTEGKARSLDDRHIAPESIEAIPRTSTTRAAEKLAQSALPGAQRRRETASKGARNRGPDPARRRSPRAPIRSSPLYERAPVEFASAKPGLPRPRSSLPTPWSSRSTRASGLKGRVGAQRGAGEAGGFGLRGPPSIGVSFGSYCEPGSCRRVPVRLEFAAQQAAAMAHPGDSGGRQGAGQVVTSPVPNSCSFLRHPLQPPRTRAALVLHPLIRLEGAFEEDLCKVAVAESLVRAREESSRRCSRPRPRCNG